MASWDQKIQLKALLTIRPAKPFLSTDFHALMSSLNAIDSVMLERCWTLLKKARRILIGAGVGLSIDAGIDYTDPIHFAKHFPVAKKTTSEGSELCKSNSNATNKRS